MKGGREQVDTENWNKNKIEREDQNQIDLSSPSPLTLPPELITRIFAQLDCIDLIHCSLVCKQWYVDSIELREGWKNEYLEACYLFGLRIKRETHPPSTTCTIRGYSYGFLQHERRSFNMMFILVEGSNMISKA